MTEQKPFRVIIVGAGISGVCLSHALQLAKIDHIVLEKHDKVYSYSGGAIGLWPQTSRVFDQFGCLETFEDACSPFSNELSHLDDGSVISGYGIWKPMAEAFDQKTLCLDRNSCIRKLYESLPDRSRVVTGKRILDITQSEKGVKAILDDGSVIEADILVGTDGVHSFVREIMWKHAEQQEPGSIPQSEKESLTSEYNAIFGCSKLPAGLGPGDSHVVCGHGRTSLVFTQPDCAYWAVSFKADKKRVWPFKVKFTEEDTEKAAAKLSSLKITNDVSFTDLWKGQMRSGMVTVQEGVLTRWHHGRVVLVGDAAHKMSVDIAMGANAAIEGVVTLANLLNRELKSDRAKHLSTAEISALFQEYTDKHRPRVVLFSRASGEVLRMNSFETLWKKFSVIYIFPYMHTAMISNFMALLAMGPKLDYVPVRQTNEKARGWVLKRKKSRYDILMNSLFTLCAIGGAVGTYALVTRQFPKFSLF